MKLKLVEKQQEVGDVTSFFFKPEETFEWRAGQFLHYKLPHENMDDRRDTRWFTIASASFEGRVRLSTRLINRRSSFKDTLQRLEVGDTIDVDGPEGEFVMDDPNKEYIFVAAGIGITPFRSILVDADHRQLQPNVKLLYISTDERPLFIDTFEAISQHNSKFVLKVSPEITKEAVSELLETAQDPYVLITGPEPMVESVTLLFKTLGVKGDHIKTDYFVGYEK